MSHLMSHELGQAVLNYLGTQPYVQVAQMIAGMQQMGEIDDEQLGQFLATQQDVPLPEAAAEPTEHTQDEASGD